MQKSFLVRILRTCSKKEFRDMAKWFASPMHNLRKDVAKLFEYLMEEDHLYNDSFLEKEAAFKWIFSKEAYDDAKMRQTMYFTTKCVEEFLIYEALREDEVRARTALGNVYRKRKLDKPFQKNIRETKKLQEKQEFRNGQYLRNEYFIQQEQYYYLSGVKRLELNLQQMSDALDASYIADKLRQSCLMLAHQAVYKKQDYEIGMLDDVLKTVKTKDFLNHPAIAMYYFSYMAQTEKEDESHFLNLKHEIMEYGHLLPKAEIRDIYLLALNYCIGRINAGMSHYYRESFELYRRGLEQKVLLDGNVLSRYTFINVVTIGTNLREFDWVKFFIDDFQKYIEDKYRESIVSYSLGRLHFFRKEYDKAMVLFSQVEYDDILMNLNAKVMQIQMFYEQDDFDVLESLLESMRTYLVRKKVIGYHRNNYKNILRFTKKLVKTNPYSTSQRDKLKKEIEEASPLTEKKWLLEKLEDL
jgi:hypothetical protein